MSIDKISLGNKLKRCRDNLSLTLSEVSTKTGINQDRINKIETGEVEPKGDEVLIFADLYLQDFRYFISNQTLSSSEKVETFYRKFGENFDKEDRMAIQEFLFLCENEEYVFRIQSVEKKDFSFNFTGNVYTKQGIEAAQKLRTFLGYSGRELYDNIYYEFRKLGIHIFRRKLKNSNISGLFIKHPYAGKCILVNYTDDNYRQNFTVAHEVGHALMDSNIENNISLSQQNSDFREYRANAFAGSFLVPEEAIRSFNFSSLSETLIIALCSQLRVNVMTLLIALKNYDKITNTEFEKFKSLRIPRAQKEDYEFSNLTEKRRGTVKHVIERGLSESYIKSCHEAYQKQLISQGKLAEMLLIDDSELSDLLNLFNLKLNYDY